MFLDLVSIYKYIFFGGIVGLNFKFAASRRAEIYFGSEPLLPLDLSTFNPSSLSQETEIDLFSACSVGL